MTNGSGRRRVRVSRKAPLILLFVIVLLVGVVSLAAAQTILYVDIDATGANNGSSWTDAYTDLQDALAEAGAGSGSYEIWVVEGTYKPTGVADPTATFHLLDGVALYGGFAGGESSLSERDWVGHETILSGDLNEDDDTDAYGNFIHRGDNAYHVVTGSSTDASAVLDGFIVRGGHRRVGDFLTDPDDPDVHGAGMYNVAGSPTVAHCTFTGNTAVVGGGMYNEDSSPTVSDCTFSDNDSTLGGAGMCNKNSDPTVTDCTFCDNVTVGAGSGVFNDNSDPTIIGCAFLGNYDGGGMYNYESSPTVIDCTFSGNRRFDGGGMHNADSNPTVTGCTFSSNKASNCGGGMYNSGSNPTVTGCSFSNNKAYSSGGGMHNTDSSPTVTSCTFSTNEAFGNGGGMCNTSSSPTVTDCAFSSNAAGPVTGAGGGMYNEDSGPTVTGCTFFRNFAGYGGGGGMYNVNSSLTVGNCAFNSNSSDVGGGMRNYGSDVLVTGCTFSRNSGITFGGGGMYNAGGTLTVTDCTFSGNNGGAFGGGGGMHNEGGTLTVINCTFSSNSAEDHGGGIFSNTSDATVKNTILVGNTPDNCNEFVTSAGYNLDCDGSCFTDGANHDITAPGLHLEPLADNGGPTLTQALLPGSPALDAIPSANDYNGAPTTDQRGFPRPYPVGGLADIGAVEMQRPYSRGDVNGDGAIDLLDVVLCQQIARGWVGGTPQQRAAADVDDDGDVDEDDVTILSEVVLGVRTTLP